jgi:steroid 5-alpha reductase family enzyme
LLACPMVMLALFVFISCPMMDNRSLKRRSDYKEYMDKTPQLIMWFVRD